jgi:hypothetical protein
MPFISVTRLRIRAWRFLPRFLWMTFKARRQAQTSGGFRGGSLLADRARTFWTLTAWDGEADMRAYMTAGDHRRAMPRLLDWCDEASVVHWSQEGEPLPSWAEAEARMRQDGRPSKVRFPSAAHAAMAFPAPRTTGAAPIRARGPQEPRPL